MLLAVVFILTPFVPYQMRGGGEIGWNISYPRGTNRLLRFYSQSLFYICPALMAHLITQLDLLEICIHILYFLLVYTKSLPWVHSLGILFSFPLRIYSLVVFVPTICIVQKLSFNLLFYAYIPDLGLNLCSNIDIRITFGSFSK